MLTIKCPKCGEKVYLPEIRPDYVWVEDANAPIDHLKVVECKCEERIVYLMKEPESFNGV